MPRGGARPGAGRPKDPDPDPGVPLYVRLKAPERAVLDSLCVRLRMSQAELVRHAIAQLELTSR